MMTDDFARDQRGRFTTRPAGPPATQLPPDHDNQVVAAGAMGVDDLRRLRAWVRDGGGTTPQGGTVTVSRSPDGWTYVEVTDPHGWVWDADCPAAVSLDGDGRVRLVEWRQQPPEEMVEVSDGSPDGLYAVPVRETGPALTSFDAQGHLLEQVTTDPDSGAVTRATLRGRLVDLGDHSHDGDLASPYNALLRAARTGDDGRAARA
ncbi:hypothetical protein [Actinomyces gaoshouyii]|uniref:hypothetical protein n=1 Tax=Actinomyces gaoshouyii TaxID=1960083 RepID=UPI0009BCCBE9|nr:hypothetical protein [Actinomyces gaoshouyii]ARD42525.1 hypothetical protein B6G06_09360 [Actinomyces gaoshouyii]